MRKGRDYLVPLAYYEVNKEVISKKTENLHMLPAFTILRSCDRASQQISL